MGVKTPIQFELEEAERVELESRARSQAIAHRIVSRARIVLAVADGQSIAEAAREAGCGRRIARKWAQRFRLKRLAGLEDEPRSGRPPVFPPDGGHSSGQARVRAAG
jgi:hypothetical protein